MKHGGDIYSDGILKGKKLIDFSSNINPLGVPNSIVNNINEAVDMLNVYPDIKYRILKDNLIDYVNESYEYFGMEKREIKVTHDNVLLGNGASEILDLAIGALKSITIVVPSFVEYEDNAIKHGLDIKYSYLKEDFTYDYDDILNKVKGSEGLIIGNPNNPNGCIIDKEKFKTILNYCELNNKIILIDEAFIEFTLNLNLSFVDLINKYKCLVIIRAITKFYGLPGVRFGFALTTNERIIDYFNLMQNPWNINCFAEVAVKYGLKDEKYILESINWIKVERHLMLEELDKAKFVNTVYNTYGNYILLKLKDINCHKFYEKLKKKGIIIRKCDNYKGLNEEFVRVAIKDRELNLRLLEAMNSL
ncbi:pyridoxal phosphate-dependent aminotransferase [Clostridium senegalense]